MNYKIYKAIQRFNYWAGKYKIDLMVHESEAVPGYFNFLYFKGDHYIMYRIDSEYMLDKNVPRLHAYLANKAMERQVSIIK